MRYAAKETAWMFIYFIIFFSMDGYLTRIFIKQGTNKKKNNNSYI